MCWIARKRPASSIKRAVLNLGLPCAIRYQPVSYDLKILQLACCFIGTGPPPQQVCNRAQLANSAVLRNYNTSCQFVTQRPTRARTVLRPSSNCHSSRWRLVSPAARCYTFSLPLSPKTINVDCQLALTSNGSLLPRLNATLNPANAYHKVLVRVQHAAPLFGNGFECIASTCSAFNGDIGLNYCTCPLQSTIVS